MSIKGAFYIFLVVLILGEACFALWLWKDKSKYELLLTAEQRMTATQKETIDDKENTIVRLTNYKQANDAIILQFFAKVDGINGRLNTFTGTLSDLRRTNADVEKYLSAPIPPALAALLNGVCETGAACNAAGSPQ